MIDGQNSSPLTNQTNVERNDMRAGDVPIGSVRWIVWWERFSLLVDTAVDSWQLVGPEIHGATLDQATIMLQVRANKHRQLNQNAGRPQPRFSDLGLINPGEWRQMMMGFKYVDDDSGWFELWDDGVRVVYRPSDATTTEHLDGVWKLAHYRNAAVNGTSVYEICGARIYS